MYNHLREEAKEEVLDQAEGEAWLRPVVTPFENIQHVAIKIHLAVKVLLLECLKWNQFLAIVCVAVLGLGEL